MSWRAAIAGEAIFHDDDDRRFFLLTLDRAWVLMGGLLSWWKQACDGGATAEMLRCGSASAAHSSGTTVQPASYDLSNFSGGAPPSRRTVVSQEWLAGRLRMRSAANVSQQMRRLDKKRVLSRMSEALKRFWEEADGDAHE